MLDGLIVHQQRQIARGVTHGARQFNNGALALHLGMEIAHAAYAAIGASNYTPALPSNNFPRELLRVRKILPDAIHEGLVGFGLVRTFGLVDRTKADQCGRAHGELLLLMNCL
jgi:hypothetical protein